MASAEIEQGYTLKIVKQPPKLFCNQQLGQKHGFEVEVEMQGPKLTNASLKVELVYSDNLQKVTRKQPKKLGRKSKKRRTPKSILHVFETEQFPSSGRARVRARINDVSRNHKGRHFRLLIFLCTEDKVVAKAHTDSIRVISKKPKSSGPIKVISEKPTSSERPDEGHSDGRIADDTLPAASAAHPVSATTTEAPSKKRRRCVSKGKTADESHGSIVSGLAQSESESARVVNPNAHWGMRAFLMLKSLETRKIANGNGVVLTECPSCFQTSYIPNKMQHLSSCILAKIVKNYSRVSTKQPTHHK